MELGMIGLGRMGANMAERLVRGGHRVIGFDPKPESRQRIEDKPKTVYHDHLDFTHGIPAVKPETAQS